MIKHILILISCIFLLAGCGQKAQQEPEVLVVRVQKINFLASDSSSQYPGTVRGRYESNLGFQVGGKIASRRVNIGDSVAAGDILMQIDKKDIEQSVNLAAAQVSAASSKLELDRTNFARYQQLYNAGAVSAVQYDQMKTQYDASLASYNQANAQYVQSANSLSYTDLRADRPGVIAQVNAEAGQVVAAGQIVAVLIENREHGS